MNGRIAIITGGSRGLGKNAALKLAERGVDVLSPTTAGKRKPMPWQLKSCVLAAKGWPCRSTSAPAPRFGAFSERVKVELATNWQRSTFDFLVNNAGSGIRAPFGETTEAQFDLMMNIHLKGVFFLTQSLLPLMADGGRILNVSSGLTRSLPGHSAYASMKGAVEVLTRYLAKELGGRGIAVNVIAPGAIETDFGGGAVRDNPDLNAFIASPDHPGPRGAAG